jgi:hypothetical protein
VRAQGVGNTAAVPTGARAIARFCSTRFRAPLLAASDVPPLVMFAIQLHILPGAHSVRFLLPSSLLFMSPWPAPTPTDTRADCAKTARRISRARHPGPVPARLQARPRRTIALDAGTFVPSAHALFYSHAPRARRMSLSSALYRASPGLIGTVLRAG